MTRGVAFGGSSWIRYPVAGTHARVALVGGGLGIHLGTRHGQAACNGAPLIRRLGDRLEVNLTAVLADVTCTRCHETLTREGRGC